MHEGSEPWLLACKGIRAHLNLCFMEFHINANNYVAQSSSNCFSISKYLF